MLFWSNWSAARSRQTGSSAGNRQTHFGFAVIFSANAILDKTGPQVKQTGYASQVLTENLDRRLNFPWRADLDSAADLIANRCSASQWRIAHPCRQETDFIFNSLDISGVDSRVIYHSVLYRSCFYAGPD